MYGELINQDLKEVIKDTAKKLEPRKQFIGKNISDTEQKTFSRLITILKFET